MKTNILKSLLFVALTVFSFACSDDDDASHPLDGIWKYDNYLSTCDDSSMDFTYTFTCTEQECQRLKFANGVATELITFDGSQGEGESSTYSINGNKIVTEDGEIVEFAIANNTLTLTTAKDSEGCITVTTLSKDN